MHNNCRPPADKRLLEATAHTSLNSKNRHLMRLLCLSTIRPPGRQFRLELRMSLLLEILNSKLLKRSRILQKLNRRYHCKQRLLCRHNFFLRNLVMGLDLGRDLDLEQLTLASRRKEESLCL